jgi:hypothetical protein
MNRAGVCLTAAVTFFALACLPASAQDLKLSCGSPAFPAKEPTPIDSSCGAAGKGGKETAQNTQKNDFCASGDPAAITFDKLNRLQTQVENKKSIPFGDKSEGTRKAGPATDRTALKQIGEGNLVVLSGFVLIARQEGGESVNCGDQVPDNPVNHDIHISLVEAADQSDECKSVVAEMSPHHRPAEWTADNVNLLAKTHAPVRATGHLFFDSSHLPCASDQRVRSNPKRSSLWEVHPIYKFEVCTEKCDGAGTWVDLVDWVKSRPANAQ